LGHCSAESPRDASVWISADGFSNTPVTVGARYANGQFTTLIGADPTFVGPPTGPVAVTSTNVAYFASLAYEPIGSSPPTGTAFVELDGVSAGANFTVLWPGTISDVAADNRGNLWYILGCSCSQFIPYSFVAEGPTDANPPGQLVVPLGDYGLGLQALAISPDGNTIWVAASGNVDRVSSNGTILQTYALPAGASISGMAAISNGSVWYTDSGHNAIVNLSSTGAFSSYPVPSKSSGVDRIAVGGDGALWFTENSANKIGRITPQGLMHEYPIPTANAAPAGIAGPNGAGCNPDVVWFVEQNAGKIGEITIQS